MWTGIVLSKLDFYHFFGAKIQIVLRFDNRMQQNRILRIEFSYGVVVAKKGAQIVFFFTVVVSDAKHSKEFMIWISPWDTTKIMSLKVNLCVCLLYADFELLGKLFQAHNIVTSSSFLSIILQHTVCQNQPKKSHF